MPFDNDLIIRELLEFLKSYKDITGVILFGSRARGDNHRLSDYDIAISGNLNTLQKSEIYNFCEEEIHTLLKIDVVFMQGPYISQALIENIKKDGVTLYEKK